MQIEINTNKLYAFRPEKIIAIALCVFGGLLIIAPIRIDINTVDSSSVWYLILSFIGFWLGTKLIKTKKIKSYYITVDTKYIESIYRTTFILGVSGIIFKLIDFIVYRNMRIGNILLDNMQNAIETEGSIFSILSAFIIFFAYVPFTIDFVFNLHKKRKKCISILLLLGTGLSAIFSGSRNAIMIPIVYMAIIILYTQRKTVTFKRIFAYIGVAIAMIYISGAIFIQRLNEMNVSILTASSSNTGGYSDKVPVTDNYYQLMQKTENNILSPLLFGYLNFCQYFTHAVFEFPTVKRYVDDQGDFYYGTATFGVATKLFQRLFNGGDIVNSINQHNARQGIWSTFFFLWYLDFGWLGILMMVLFGYICKKIWAIAYYDGKIMLLPLVAYMSIILLFVLQLNMLYGVGLYAIVSFTVLPYLKRVVI